MQRLFFCRTEATAFVASENSNGLSVVRSVTLSKSRLSILYDTIVEGCGLWLDWAVQTMQRSAFKSLH